MKRPGTKIPEEVLINSFEGIHHQSDKTRWFFENKSGPRFLEIADGDYVAIHYKEAKIEEGMDYSQWLMKARWTYKSFYKPGMDINIAGRRVIIRKKIEDK